MSIQILISGFNENGKKAIGLDWQNNNLARASRFFVHFLAVMQTFHFRLTCVAQNRLCISFLIPLALECRTNYYDVSSTRCLFAY